MNHGTKTIELPELTANLLRDEGCLIDNLFADLWKHMGMKARLNRIGFPKRSGTSAQELHQPFRDGRSIVAKRYRVAQGQTKPQMVGDMIRRAQRAGIEADYLLADAWFGTKPIIPPGRRATIDTDSADEEEHHEISANRTQGRASNPPG